LLPGTYDRELNSYPSILKPRILQHGSYFQRKEMRRHGVGVGTVPILDTNAKDITLWPLVYGTPWCCPLKWRDIQQLDYVALLVFQSKALRDAHVRDVSLPSLKWFSDYPAAKTLHVNNRL
jgi:hypothetical protein